MKNDILIVGPCAILRAGMISLMRDMDGVNACSEAESLEEARYLLASVNNFPFMFIDIDETDPDEIGNLLREFSGVEIAVIATECGRNVTLRAFAQGSRGVIPKAATAKATREAIEQILAGRNFVPAAALEKGAARLREAEPANDIVALPGNFRLTERQRDVMEYLAKGQSNKEIARSLSISENTVKIHVSAAFRQMGVRNRLAALAALQGGSMRALSHEPAVANLANQRRRKTDQAMAS